MLAPRHKPIEPEPGQEGQGVLNQRRDHGQDRSAARRHRRTTKQEKLRSLERQRTNIKKARAKNRLAFLSRCEQGVGVAIPIVLESGCYATQTVTRI
jgi:hypothetical protein